MNRLTLSRALLLFATTILGVGRSYPQTLGPAVMPPEQGVGYARSHARMLVPAEGTSPAFVHGPGQTSATCSTSGGGCYYFPNDILTAYAINSIANGNGGAGMTVAVVDAFYNPQTETDLTVFSSFFGLPACTRSNGCLTIVNQSGGTDLSSVGFDMSWSRETNLDVQTIHAIAPKAKILLIACNDNSLANLGTGLLYAQTHANVVSNSYGGNEFAGETSLDDFYFTSSIPILFSSGDMTTTEFPCTSVHVVCVGGTSLLETAAGFRSVETAWGGATTSGGSGGGCSSQVGAPAFQTGFSTCGVFRGVPDIAALADEYTGFVIYLGASASGGNSGLYVFGGTSLASPLMASIVAIIDTARVTIGKAPLGANLNALLYQAAANPYYRYRFYDVATGTNGANNAAAGWDPAAGLGVILGPSLASYLIGLP